MSKKAIDKIVDMYQEVVKHRDSLLQRAAHASMESLRAESAQRIITLEAEKIEWARKFGLANGKLAKWKLDIDILEEENRELEKSNGHLKDLTREQEGALKAVKNLPKEDRSMHTALHAAKDENTRLKNVCEAQLLELKNRRDRIKDLGGNVNVLG